MNCVKIFLFVSVVEIDMKFVFFSSLMEVPEQGCSENNITVVLDRKDTIRGLRAVHSRFYLSETPIAVGLIGPGLIGATFIKQMHEQVSYITDFLETRILEYLTLGLNMF